MDELQLTSTRAGQRAATIHVMNQRTVVQLIRSAMLAALAGVACTPEPLPVVAAPIELPIAAATAFAKPRAIPIAAPATTENEIATALPAASAKRPRSARRPATKSCCAGKNDCKGQSGCSTASASCSGMTSCAGQNECKGKGTSCPPGSSNP